MLLPRQCFMYAAHDQNHRTLICVAAMIVCQSTYVHLHVWMEDFFTCCNGWEWVYVELTLSHISAAVTGNTLMDSRTSNVVLMKTKAHTQRYKCVKVSIFLLSVILSFSLLSSILLHIFMTDRRVWVNAFIMTRLTQFEVACCAYWSWWATTWEFDIFI